MGIGSFAMTCLLLAAGAGSPPAPAPVADELYMNQTQFKIPFHIKPEAQAEIEELRLFCSRDEGKQWNRVGKASPNQDGFLFDTRGDGKYWFKVAVVNKKGVQIPTDVYAGPVDKKIVLDTVRPEIHVGAEREGEAINVAWEITEVYPRSESLRVEYHSADAPEGLWTPIPIHSDQTRVSFRPVSAAAVVIRVLMEDLAGNVGTSQTTVAAAAPNAIVQVTQPPPPSDPPSAAPTPILLPGSTAGTTPLTPPGNTAPVVRPAETPTHTSLPTSPTQPTPAQNTSLTGGANLPLRGALPQLQIVNKAQVRLDYEVAKLGPSGVGSVDVYVTADEGQTWERSRVEAAAGAPVPDPTSATLNGGVIVHLPKDEVSYGFYMVVKSRAGLGKPAPKSGDLPQIRIERDTIAPAATWKSPMADTNRRDTLILSWDASDKNLAVNPISIEWANDKLKGPWQFIGGPELPNTGRYTWTVPADVLPRVYFRLTVRDTAGNTTIKESEQPELVDLSVPEITTIHVGNGIR